MLQAPCVLMSCYGLLVPRWLLQYIAAEVETFRGCESGACPPADANVFSITSSRFSFVVMGFLEKFTLMFTRYFCLFCLFTFVLRRKHTYCLFQDPAGKTGFCPI